MKYILFLASVMLVMSACTTQYQASNYDDVYYSSKNQQPEPKHSMVVKTPESDLNSYSGNETSQPQQEQTATNRVYDNPDSTGYSENQQYSSEHHL